jgi:hypothetical protein
MQIFIAEQINQNLKRGNLFGESLRLLVLNGRTINKSAFEVQKYNRKVVSANG